MDPISLAIAGANLAGGIFGSRSARKQRRQLKAELERRRQALIEGKNLAIGRIAEGTAAAKAPLEAIAERVRTEEDFRNPVLEQALAQGVRQNLGAELRKQQATRGDAAQAIPQQQLLMAAALSQTLLASESRRVARRTESTRALSQIYSQLSEVTQAGAHSAANIEGQFSSAIANLPMPPQGDAMAAGLGGFLSFLGTDAGKEGLGSLFKMFQGGGSPPGLPPFLQGGNAFDSLGQEISTL